MEVTKISDKVTHAVIGRGQVESFGMSEDAELYHILSSALYSRKKEAAVREVLCNAWDSHVESEITDVPVQVTITNEKLIIRDFGAGLHPEKIKPVYGTYGKSTKQHDGRQTGGFGLGSKAPFAYTDHFEVISCHDNVKTIYKMSQSNAEVGGKPSITTIVSVPTTESGLQVTINLKTPEDRHEFEQLVVRLVEMGDMNVTLNGRHLDTIPFSESEMGFMLVKAERFSQSSYGQIKDRIYIRYGHVVYPLNSDDRFAHLYDETTKFMETLTTKDRWGNLRDRWVLVLQAEPHSITVTPSREDLSMTDRTVAAVSELLRHFMGYARGRLENTVTEMFEDAVDKVGIIGTPEMFFRSQKAVPLVERVPVARRDENFIYDFDTLSRRYMLSSYPQFDNFRMKDLRIKVEALIRTGFGNRGVLQSFKSELLSKNVRDSETTTQWFHKRLVALALRGYLTHQAVDPTRLYVYTNVGKGRYKTDIQPGFVEAAKWVAPNVEKCLPFLRNLLILTCSKTMNQIERADSFPICRHWVGDPLHSLCYVVPRKTEKIDAARQHFERLGFTVLDLTKVQPWEHEEVMAPVVKAVYKPKKKGVVTLAAGLSETQKSWETDRLWKDEAARVIKPEVVVKVSSQKSNTNSLPAYMSHQVEAIARLYGKVIGIVQNSTQEEKYQNEGAKEMKPWLAQKVLEEYKANPLIEQHYRFSVSHRDKDALAWDQDRFYKLIWKDDVLRKHFGFPDRIDQNERDIIVIFEMFNRWERDRFPEIKEIDTLIKSWTLDPKAKDLYTKIKHSKLLSILDSSDLEMFITNTNKSITPKQVQAARDILLLTLES